MTDVMNRRVTRRKVIQHAAVAGATGGGAVTALSIVGRATARQDATATQGGGTLVFGYGQPTSFVNTCLPWFYAGGTDIYLRRFVGADLVTSSENFDEWLPDMAESWTFDGNVATFKLRQGVTWHDGAPFTARDVLFTFRVMAHPNTVDVNFGYDSLFPLIAGVKEFREGTADTISGIQAPDDFTVAIEMVSPQPEALLAALDWTVLLPEHILSQLPEEQWGNNGICTTEYGLSSPIGTGPFVMTNYVVDQVVEYEPFEHYWRGKPLLDKLVYRPFADGQALAAALESGEVHVGTISPSDYKRFQEMDHLHIIEQPGGGGRTLYVNTRQPYLNQQVRQALLLSLDRATISETIYQGLAEAPQATFFIPRYGVNPDVAPFFSYDPERAQQLLAEGGWDSNRKIRFLMSEIDPADEPLYALMRSDWEAVGVQSEFQVVGSTAFDSYFTEPYNFDVYLSGYGWDTALTILRVYFDDESVTGVVNDQALAVLEETLALEDPEAIKQGVWRLQVLAAEQASHLPIADASLLWVINNQVQGDFQPVHLAWTSNYWGLEKVWVQG